MSTIPSASRALPARRVALAAGALVILGVLAYAGAWNAPFVFDDMGAIVANDSLRSFARALFPPPHLTVSGRPLLNVTFAFNHAISGTSPWSYHLGNLLIHLANGVLLLGFIHRAVHRWATHAGGGLARISPGAIAGCVTALWLLHPLQTESVTYVVQRAESLMALCVLGTLVTFERSVTSARPGWQAASIGCCLLGMATKEVTAVVPLLVLFYDRAFVAGSFRQAWTARRGLYLGYAATWALLAWLVWGTAGRGDSAGFGTSVSPWSYALTQFGAIVRYARLALWPDTLVLDYGTALVSDARMIVLPALVVLVGAGATLWATPRNHPLGFIGVWWFALLAPSSSIVPIATQTMAEHRVYLPLAALIVLVVLALQRVLSTRGQAAAIVAAVALALSTAARNALYRDELALWCDVVAKQPANPRGHSGAAAVLGARGHFAAALPFYREALRLDPNDADIHYHCAETLARLGQFEAALPHYVAATESAKAFPEAFCRHGGALARLGRPQEAIAPLERALRLQPNYAEAHADLGAARLQLGEWDAAIASLTAARRLKPQLIEVRANLGLALLRARRFGEARVELEAVRAAAPTDDAALNNLAYLALEEGNPAEAVQRYAEVTRLRPAEPLAHYNLAIAHARAGDRRAALANLEQALRLQPDFTAARRYLEQLRTGR